MFDTPETAEEETIIKEKISNKVIYLVVVSLVLLIGVSWFIIKTQTAPAGELLQDSATNIDSSDALFELLEDRVLNEAKVVSVDAENNKFSISITKDKVSLDGDQYAEIEEVVIEASPNTTIYKLILSENDKGEVEKSGRVEIGVAGISVGEQISIEYVDTESNEVSDQVKSITIVVNTDTENFDRVYQEESVKSFDGSFLRIEGEVAGIDAALSNVSLNTQSSFQNEVKTITVTLQEGAKVYSVDGASRVHIKHARAEALFSDIQLKGTVFAVLNDDTDLSQENIIAKSIIIVN